MNGLFPFESQADFPPMIVDSFAGGGGASTGIEMALGRSPDIAINHNPAALALHAASLPANFAGRVLPISANCRRTAAFLPADIAGRCAT